MKRITIKDVAKLANVSISTVSFTFNTPSRVDPNTREIVLNAARMLNYSPNFNALALRGKSKTIAVITNFHSDQALQNPTSVEGIPFIAQLLTQHGYYFMPFFTKPDDPENEQLISMIKQNQIAGVIFLSTRTNTHILNIITQQSIPLVVVGTLSNYHQKIYSVDNNNTHDVYQATMIAYNYGYKKIAYISGDLDYLVCQQRLQGYTQAINEKNLHTPIVHGICEDREQIENTIEMIVSDKEIDAIVTKDDIKGIYTINKLQNMGYTVGKDIGVIGIGGVTAGTFCNPQLSTMGFSIQDIFIQATDILIKQIQQQELHLNHYIVPTTYIERGSLIQQ